MADGELRRPAAELSVGRRELKGSAGTALDSDSSRVRFPTTMRRVVLFAAVLVLLGGSAAEAARPGYAWHDLATGTTAHFRGLAAVSATTAWISGYTPTDGVVMRTTDGGATWQDVTPPGAAALQFRDIEAFDADDA